MAAEGLLSGRLLAHATAGAAGSVLAMATFYPLDAVRSRLQLQGGGRAKHTLAELRALAAGGGPAALYRGMGPVLQSLCVSNFVYFYTFHALKAARRRRGARDGAAADLALAAAAGAANVLATNPLWVVNTRLKAEGGAPYAGLWQGVAAVARAEGVARLWSGVAPSLLLVCNPALQFMTYEALKRRLLKGGPQAHPALAYFLLGAAAKAVATLLTYPLQLLQAQMRVGKGGGRGLLALAAHVLRRHGLAGLYRGLEAKLLQTVLTAALMFAAYEKIAAFILSLLLGRAR